MNVGVIRVFRVRVFWAWFLGCGSDALLAEGDVRTAGRPTGGEVYVDGAILRKAAIVV
jgi:hypothetical protein